jgi:uncharacterized membrane protein YdbT with pleckstrin-like domain
MEVHARPHGAALIRPLGRAVLTAAGGAACILLGTGVHWLLAAFGAAAVIVAAVGAVGSVVGWERTDVFLSSATLRVRWGVIRRHSAEVRLSAEEPVEIEQGLVGRVLGYGTVMAGGIEVPYVPLGGPGRT